MCEKGKLPERVGRKAVSLNSIPRDEQGRQVPQEAEMVKIFLRLVLVVTFVIPSTYVIAISQTYRLSVTIPEQVTLGNSIQDTKAALTYQEQRLVRNNQVVVVKTTVVP